MRDVEGCSWFLSPGIKGRGLEDPSKRKNGAWKESRAEAGVEPPVRAPFEAVFEAIEAAGAETILEAILEAVEASSVKASIEAGAEEGVVAEAGIEPTSEARHDPTAEARVGPVRKTTAHVLSVKLARGLQHHQQRQGPYTEKQK